MNNPLLLSKCIYYAATAHKGDVDKSGLPYILHPLRVMEATLKEYPNDVEAAGAAVMHDVKEDHPGLWKLWHKQVTPRTEALVDNLSRGHEETYGQFIDRIINSQDVVLISIKSNDVWDNWQVRPTPPGMEAKMKVYEDAHNKLTNALWLLARKKENAA